MNESLEKWSGMVKKAQAPFQAIAELNVKTLQGFTYLKPEDMAKLKNPEELFEKQFSMAVENSHRALDYMQKAFLIMERAMLSSVQELRNGAERKH